MAYLTKNIDRAIVMTQADLRGFFHPLGIRLKPNSAKDVFYATINLPGFMSGSSKDEEEERDETYVSALDNDATYEQHVAMAKAMADACDLSQAEAIDLILQRIAREMSRFRKQHEAGEYEGNANYIGKLDKETTWGRTFLAMREGFAEKFKAARESYS